MIMNIDAKSGLTWTTGTLSEAKALEHERARMRCSKFQAKAALLQTGLLEGAEAVVAEADALTQIAWADAVEFRRNSPTIKVLAGKMGLTDAQVDDLFRRAMEIEA